MRTALLALLAIFVFSANAETVTAKNLVLDLPIGWISVPQKTNDALELRFPSDPVEVALHVQKLPDLEPQKVEALAKHMLETIARMHEAAVKKAGGTSAEVKTSIQPISGGWRILMAGGDQSARRFVQISLVTSNAMTMVYTHSMNHDVDALLAISNDLLKRVQITP